MYPLHGSKLVHAYLMLRERHCALEVAGVLGLRPWLKVVVKTREESDSDIVGWSLLSTAR